nr:NADH dehydrogenase subunit 5 [Lernaea cyprinacea]
MMVFLCGLFIGVFSTSLLMYFFLSELVILLEWKFLETFGLDYQWVMVVDKMSLMFLMTVSLISFSVYLFSVDYMSNELNYYRFHTLLFVFVFSMYLLILSPNLISMMVGWDGLGLSSFLLVIFYSNIKSLNSGLITLLSNRVGDVMLMILIGYLLTLGEFTSVDYKWGVFSSLMTIVLMSAAFTKSAQIPFMAWLPAAMAAPTPVSSLVHSSTLVTAGVYLLIRHQELLNYFLMNTWIFYIGLISCLAASLSALVECDLKKIIALSTLSQLGVMMVSIGLGSSLLAFSHLVGHAMFKALMFISVGNFIHSANNYQDMRFMGMNYFFTKWINSFMLLSVLSLMAFPFMVAFFTKELIFEMSVLNLLGSLEILLFYFTILLTPVYSYRLFYLYSIKQSNQMLLMNSSHPSLVNYMSLIILSLPATVVGGFLKMFLYSIPMISISSKMFKMTTSLLVPTMFLIMSVSGLYFKNLKELVFLKLVGSLLFLNYLTPAVSFKAKEVAQLSFSYLDKSIISGSYNLMIKEMWTHIQGTGPLFQVDRTKIFLLFYFLGLGMFLVGAF